MLFSLFCTSAFYFCNINGSKEVLNLKKKNKIFIWLVMNNVRTVFIMIRPEK